MLLRIRTLCVGMAVFAVVASGRAANLDGSDAQVGNPEAGRLVAEANDFVGNMAEGQYSYSYLQFYWKRAQSNLDRVKRVYPDSPAARALSGDAKIGPFPLAYFRDRVLYNLELKRLGAFDDVNCAIFLYGLDEARNDAKRDQALADIIEVLSRRQRWGEAERFPVLAAHRPILLGTMFRVAAFYGVEEVMARMRARTPAGERAAAHFDALMAEGLALRGRPRAELLKFVADHPTDEVRNAALRGVIDRELMIRRMTRLKIPFSTTIQNVHSVVQNVTLRDDVMTLAPQICGGSLDAAKPFLSVYSAGLGTAPARSDPVAAHVAYLQFLADAGRFEALATYPKDAGLAGSALRTVKLAQIEFLAEAGEVPAADKARLAFAPAFSSDADEAALAEFRGRVDSTALPLVAREKTFADLPIGDPCIMATAIMEWSLSPNRSQRGATPWDAVVFRFAGGFDHLPLPKSAVVGDAASTLKPY